MNYCPHARPEGHMCPHCLGINHPVHKESPVSQCCECERPYGVFLKEEGRCIKCGLMMDIPAIKERLFHPTEVSQSAWETELEKILRGSRTRGWLASLPFTELKSFISHLLSDARKEERERVVEYVAKNADMADSMLNRAVLMAARTLPSQEVT